jgi:ABC-type multidrug transport system fused ATPase/permease subunit
LLDNSDINDKEMNSENPKKLNDFEEWRLKEARQDPKWRRIASNQALWASIFLFGVFIYQTIRDTLGGSEELIERLNRIDDTLKEDTSNVSQINSPKEHQPTGVNNTIESENTQKSSEKLNQATSVQTELSTIDLRKKIIKKIEDEIEKVERRKNTIFSFLVFSSITTFVFLILGAFIILTQDKITIGVISGIIALFSGAGTTGFWKLLDNVSADIEKYREKLEKNLNALEGLSER